jgi:hypothetical protein
MGGERWKDPSVKPSAKGGRSREQAAEKTKYVNALQVVGGGEQHQTEQ